MNAQELFQQLRLLPLKDQQNILLALGQDIGEYADENRSFDPHATSPELWLDIQHRFTQYAEGATCLIPFEEHVHFLNNLA